MSSYLPLLSKRVQMYALPRKKENVRPKKKVPGQSHYVVSVSVLCVQCGCAIAVKSKPACMLMSRARFAEYQCKIGNIEKLRRKKTLA